MKLKPHLILLFLLIIIVNLIDYGLATRKIVTPEDIEKIKLDQKGFDKIKTIHTNWYVHSLKALMVQLSKQLLPKLPRDLKSAFLRCLKRIHDKKDIVSAARCVSDSREAYDEWKIQRKNQRKPDQKTVNGNQTTQPTTTSTTTEISTSTVLTLLNNSESEQAASASSTSSLPLDLVQSFYKVHKTEQNHLQKLQILIRNEDKVMKMKRFWKNRKNYDGRKTEEKKDVADHLRNMYKDRMKTLMPKLSRKMLKKLIEKNRKLKEKYMQRRSKRSLQRLVVDGVSKSDSDGFVIKSQDSMKSLKSSSKSVVQRVAGLFQTFFRNESDSNISDRWSDTYKQLLILKKKMDTKEKEPGAKVYNQKMYDLVMDVPESEQKVDKSEMPDLLVKAFDLMAAFDKSDKKASGTPNYKFLSPRFASIMPDKNENRGKLSPSILSFYNDESEDQIMPIPKMLESTGMNERDRESLIEMVMEVSGAKKVVYDAMKVLKAIELPELDVALSENAKKSMDMVREIQDSIKGKQKKEMDKKGFAIMEPHQMRKLMNEQGIGDRKDIFDVDVYEKKTIRERKEMVWDIVRDIAYGPAKNGTRVKRQASVWGPHVLAPTILTPLLFTPIFGLNVLAPTILSPGVFTPLILNPAVLSPYIFSPSVGIPFILSPYVLSPYMFSPLVMAPFILNPYVLSPNVFNPYVLSPLVLSPLVICPDVVSPMVLGGAILSPGVLSPSVLSKSYLMANVLSPTVLS